MLLKACKRWTTLPEGVNSPRFCLQNLLDLQERHHSMVLPGAESVGIITIEDVIEELLQQVPPPSV